MRVHVKAELFRWACERSGQSRERLAGRFPKLQEWMREEADPTLKQLEEFARATFTPLGFFFLAEPPGEPLPIPDFRTMHGHPASRPSANLLDTIYSCQQRQEWYQQHSRLAGAEPLEFVGSVRPGASIARTAANIRGALGLTAPLGTLAKTASDAFRLLLDRADGLGIMVMVSGIVGNNTRRALDPQEFRGFALVDPLAPLVFVNGADTKTAQLFTLIHELAHVWSGESGVSDVAPDSPPRVQIEQWCNGVAAEVLVPLAEFKAALQSAGPISAEMNRLADRFRVSTLVVLRRMLEVERLTREEFDRAFRRESARLLALIAARSESSGRSGGNYYATARYRLGKRFATAVISSTWEGRSTFTEAFRLLGCRNVGTLEKLGEGLGMAEYLSGGAV